ncbi:MAG TPA: YbhB/YbcL family Raf kinase inhibitor-like protein [Deltaproteobacteria bacterium]|nr:YbhB/YbcL family Raf kinase inhibitor-like protein [Deltaproteobacteria bacterium]HOM29228.1 YbhB/YbcL family Raf kinase inhibitor-like protein [Deltaproteobacteria bacterium]HPP79960.1 YbhB/YbcL family Raf kinase inhibitor-like protein [Deltaproteobacteria bacterium]
MGRHLSTTAWAIVCSILALTGTPWAFELTSPAFTAGTEIPSVYTCQGRDISPPLSWSGAPAGTKSLVLVCEDPDAPLGTWVHWVYYDIPPSLSRLPEGIPKTARPPQGGTQGKSSFGDLGYGGPCPPWGTHRYFFRLYALDTVLGIPEGAKKKQVLEAMKGHVLATAELMGTYKKK